MLKHAVLALVLVLLGGQACAREGRYAEEIGLTIDSWLAVQRPSGFLPYGYDFLFDKEIEPGKLSGPNLTRQAGTASALADYYLQTGDGKAQPALKKLLTVFGRHSLPVGKSRMQAIVEQTRLLSSPIGRYKIRSALAALGLLYDPRGKGLVLSPDGSYEAARTGALALALLAEVRYHKASGDDSFAKLREAWLEGLISLMIPGEGFRTSPASIDTMPYFDGEAWLALAEYHARFPKNRRAARILAEVDEIFLSKYGQFGDAYNIDFFHWGTMAAAARYVQTRERKFLEFTKAQVVAYLGRKEAARDLHNNCASIEGVADAAWAMAVAGEKDTALLARARHWSAGQMERMNQLQIQPGQREITYGTENVIAPKLGQFAGAFLSGFQKADTRVDYAQHCVSAMLKLRRHDGVMRR